MAEIKGATGPKQRNPDWTRDELILALDLYQHDPNADQRHPRVAELSALLNIMWAATGTAVAGTLRNPNGVSMKLANFQRWDPNFIHNGRVGLTRGNRLEKEVWAEYANSPERLSAVAAAIKRTIAALPQLASTASLDTLDEVEAVEGAILTKLHRYRERDRKIVARKKASLADSQGRIRCEACSFDFSEYYGERGIGFAEVHHLQPLEAMLAGAKTRLLDLAVLCANCHRMIHARRPWLTIDELKAILAAARSR